jgi:YidC/Oxa1 family membrane protein insertase
VFELIANVLAWFYSLVHNYALAIALLTLAIMILLTPLTLKGTKSMLELQRLQPEMKRLQQQYKGDRQKLNEEMMALYKEHKINPLGGCLPLLLQAPVFLVLFRVLRAMTDTCSASQIANHAVSRCRGVTVPGNFGASYVDQKTQLYQDLAKGHTMHSFGLDLARSAASVISDNIGRGLPYILMVLVVAASSYYQQRQISARNKNQVTNPQQQMLLKVMPAIFALFSLTFPAGLIVYFLVSNLYRIGQQEYITRRFYHKEHEAEGGDGGSGTVIEKTKPSAPPAGRGKPSSGRGGSGSGAGRGSTSTGGRGSGTGSARSGGGAGSGSGSGRQGGGQGARSGNRPPAKGGGGRPAPTKGAGAKSGASGGGGAEERIAEGNGTGNGDVDRDPRTGRPQPNRSAPTGRPNRPQPRRGPGGRPTPGRPGDTTNNAGDEAGGPSAVPPGDGEPPNPGQTGRPSPRRKK